MAGLEMVIGCWFGNGCWWLVWKWLLVAGLELVADGLFGKRLLVAFFGSGCW